MRSAGSDAAALPGISKKVSELLSKCVCVRNAIHLKTPQSSQASGRVTAEVWRCCETASQQTGERKVPSDDHKTACFIRKVATVQRWQPLWLHLVKVQKLANKKELISLTGDARRREQEEECAFIAPQSWHISICCVNHTYMSCPPRNTPLSSYHVNDNAWSRGKAYPCWHIQLLFLPAEHNLHVHRPTSAALISDKALEEIAIPGRSSMSL